MPDGKVLTISTVKAYRLYVLDNESGSTSSITRDRNYVKLLGNIATEVTGGKNFTTFRVATHYITTNSEDGTESTETLFHRVIAFDGAVRQYIENTLKKSDRVLLTGKIEHQIHSTGDDGKNVYSGFVMAENVYQIERRSSATEVESNETKELNSESN